MIPILYEATETAFISNGLGRLRDCISCVVTEERNGIYECDFEYPINGNNFDKIRLGRIIAVEHDDTSDVQPFDIVSCSRAINGVVMFHAVHISYRLRGVTASGAGINSLADALDVLRTGTPSTPFTFHTDKASAGYASAFNGAPQAVRSLLGGVEGSILDAYGGEYEWNVWDVYLHASRGTERSFFIRYGVNLTDYTDETDYSETYTSVIPYWRDDSSGTVVIGDRASSGEVGLHGTDVCIPLDLTDKFESEPTKAQVKAMAMSMISASRPYLPNQTITVSFLRLQDSPEYSQFAPLMSCSLCDTINVYMSLYNTSGKYKIVKTVYDVLLERFTEMELGQLSTSLSEALGLDESSGSSSAVISQTLEVESDFALYDADVPITLKRSGQVVSLTGVVSPAAAIAGSITRYTICTIPSGLRPPMELVLPMQGSGTHRWTFRIDPTSGDVTFARYIQSGGTTYDSAPTNAWLPFHATWII